MSSTRKLTKKQKKGIAFREGKSGRKNGVGSSSRMENSEIPVSEIQDDVDAEDHEMESEAVPPEKESTISDSNARNDKGKGKGKGKDKTVEETDSVLSNKKRKRHSESEEVREGDVPKKKKKSNDEKQRFLLFVGNLKYTTSADSIKQHFSACGKFDPPPSVRLLTPKSSTPNAKSKGCAFLEFTHRNALQQALKLHQSQLEGRSINVELTAGGGGKSTGRLQKVQERNKKLHEQRTRHAKSGENDSRDSQRYSTTSGIGFIPDAKRTWAVGDTEVGTVHRGGKRHNKKTGMKHKPRGTGVNAIPVG